MFQEQSLLALIAYTLAFSNPYDHFTLVEWFSQVKQHPRGVASRMPLGYWCFMYMPYDGVMLQLYIGTDRVKVGKALNDAVAKDKSVSTVRITDAHTIEDLTAALAGGGLFDEIRTIILEGSFANEEMRLLITNTLPMMHTAPDAFHIIEGKLDAATKRLIEKHAESTTSFDLLKKTQRASNIFAIADALKRGDRKQLWIDYQRALAEGTAGEAIHGVLFWGAKDMLLKARDEKIRLQAKSFVADLAQLPHAARRRGEDVNYALERFVLSRV